MAKKSTSMPSGAQSAPAEKNAKPAKRAYHSPRRQEQANVTKERIVTAAMSQLQEKGYTSMTLESVAREAGVAPQTVYAVCGSKKGLLAAILENSVESHHYDELRDTIPQLKSGTERIEAMARFMTLILENQAPGFQVARGMGMLSPDLGMIETDQDMMMYEKAHGQILQMAADGLLRPGLDVESATDIYWALSSPGIFRRLTVLRGWSPERFTAFLTRLYSLLLKDMPVPFESPFWANPPGSDPESGPKPE